MTFQVKIYVFLCLSIFVPFVFSNSRFQFILMSQTVTNNFNFNSHCFHNRECCATRIAFKYFNVRFSFFLCGWFSWCLECWLGGIILNLQTLISLLFWHFQMKNFACLNAWIFMKLFITNYNKQTKNQQLD